MAKSLPDNWLDGVRPDCSAKPSQLIVAMKDLKRVQCPLIVGLFLILVGLFHVYLYVKFTPVYVETQCGDIMATMDDFELGVQSIRLGLLIEVSCVNPNPYSITIRDANPGRVFVGYKKHLQVGTLSILSGSVLKEEGAGTVRVRMRAHLSGPDADTLVPHFLEDSAIPVLMELRFNVGVSLSFGLGRWETSAPFKKDCGMKMAGILVNTFGDNSKGRLGPLVCRDSFDFDLQPLDPVKPSASHNDGRMRFSAAQVAPDEVKRGEQVKNVSLGLAITLSFSAGSLLLYTAWKACSRPQASPRGWPPSPSRQLASPDFFGTEARAGHPRDLASVEAALLQGGSPTMLAAIHSPSPTKEAIKGRNPLTGSRRIDRAELLDGAPSFNDERTYRLSRSPSITSAQSLNSLPRELTVASFLDQPDQQQQQQQQKHSRTASRSPSVASRRSRSENPPQFGNETQPSCDKPGYGGNSRDSQVSLGVRSATASAEAETSGEADHVRVDSSLSEDVMAMTFQEEEHNERAQAQRGQRLQEWVQQSRGSRHRLPSGGSSERSVHGASTPPVSRNGGYHSPRQRVSQSPARSSPAYSPTRDPNPLHPLK